MRLFPLKMPDRECVLRMIYMIPSDVPWWEAAVN